MRLTHLPGQTISHPPNVSCPSSSTSDQVVHIFPFRGDSDDTDVPSILLSEKLNQLADSHWSSPFNSLTLHCDSLISCSLSSLSLALCTFLRSFSKL